MAYKCLECGHIFEDGEQFMWEEAHGFSGGMREKFSGCPVCKGAYTSTIPCKMCATETVQRDIYDGICLSCLRESATMDVAIAYLRDRKLLVNFVFYTIFHVDEPANTSEKLESWCEFIAHESATTEDLVSYIIDTDDADAEDFANWLNAREVRK